MWKQFKHRRLGMIGFVVIIFFCLMAVYAPFLASSKPLVVNYKGEWFFPLFRYLFYTHFYTKLLDIFFNLLMFTLPLLLLAIWLGGKSRKYFVLAILSFQFLAFTYIIVSPPRDPSANLSLNEEYQKHFLTHSTTSFPTWESDLSFMTPYAKLNLLLHYQQLKMQQERLQKYESIYEARYNKKIPTLWQIDQNHQEEELNQLSTALKQTQNPNERAKTEARIKYILDKKKWFETESAELKYEIMPLICPFHWEDDAGGEQSLNQVVSWIDLTRINRKDLVSALIFGTRISLVIGIISVGLALLIGIPIGALAGFYGGTTDIVVSRLLEIWESMPTFFMLLMVVAITQSKSIFMVISVIGLFGWTAFSRYIRGEFFKQRNLAYVEASRSIGFHDSHIIFKHILPNAIPPLLTLLPFAIMGAITSEAGLSFLGLGEEGSTSWGVLMDEGRTAFPGESYLLWPPAILLTTLLIAIALVGDALRDTLDPKMHSVILPKRT